MIASSCLPLNYHSIGASGSPFFSSGERRHVETDVAYFFHHSDKNVLKSDLNGFFYLLSGHFSDQKHANLTAISTGNRLLFF